MDAIRVDGDVMTLLAQSASTMRSHGCPSTRVE
jgi:hypothetical protein